MLKLVLLGQLALVGQMRVEPEDIDQSLRGKKIVVEGVYSGQIGVGAQRQLRLLRSNAKFLLGRKFDEKLRAAANIEITGSVRVDGTDVLVDVASIKTLPTDLERYERGAAEIPLGDARGWYALAGWARARAKKYSSPELAERALAAYRQGVEVERKSLAGDAEGLRRLLKRLKAEKWITDVDESDLEHEILRAEFTRVDTLDPDALTEFARRVRDRLPFSDRAETPPVEPDGRKDYQARPLTVFRSQDDAGRQQLARFWQVMLLDQAHERLFARDSADPLSLADKAASEMPDYPEFTHKWLSRAKQDAQKRVAQLPRAQLESLAHRIADELGEREEASRLVADWLEHKEKELRAGEEQAAADARRLSSATPIRGARARFELGRTYAEWFAEDDARIDRAVRLLQEALAIDPSFTPAEKELEQLGLVKTADGRWLNSDERPSPVPERALGNASARVGMDADRLLAIQGAPDSRARVVTAAGVRHQWVYHAINETTYITLEDSSDGRPRVTAIRSHR